MPEIPAVLRRLAATVVWAVIAVAILAPAAGAAEFGELGRHGGGTKGKEGELKLDNETAGFGVDTTDNSVYVVDHPKHAGSEFRIQKFSTEKGKFTFVAAATFTPENAYVVQGVAVDPEMGRVYVLATQERTEEKKVPRLDEGDEAASQLYAFSTTPSGSKLVPAAGTGTEGLVADLNPQSNTLSEVLLEPHGIAVEPISKTEDTVVIVGTQDAGGSPDVHRNELWYLNSKGTLTKRWSDEKNLLEDEARSPVVYHEKVYAESEGGIWEIPSAGGEPKPFTRATIQEETFFEKEDLLSIPTIQSPEEGAGLSVSPEGEFWQTGSIRLASNGEKIYPAPAAYNSSGELIGWTGGASPASGGACSIGLYGSPLIAAGKEGDLFVLSIGTATSAEEATLIEFGPHPSSNSCPEPSATAPATAVGGKSVESSSTNQIPISKGVELSSKVTQGDVLKTEWNFGDGTTQTVSGIQQCWELAEGENTECAPQQTFVAHTFAKAGDLEVVEKITTDDLAKPVVEERAKVWIEAGAPAATTGEANPVGEETATLNGTVNPEGSARTWTKCEFVYGTSTSYGKSAPCNPKPGAETSAVKVSAALTGLEKEKLYDYKLIAAYSNEGKEVAVEGTNRTFTPGLKAPLATTEAASGVGTSSATLNAAVNAEGNTINSCKFEYGTSTAYGSSTPCSGTPTGKEAVHVSGSVAGLASSTAYHFRIVVGTSTGKTVDGADSSFTTGAVVVVPPPNEPPAPSPGPTPPPPGNNGVLPFMSAKLALAGSSTVAANGAFTVKLSCPAAAGSCSGTVTVRTAKAVKASGHKKAAIVTLASGSFTIVAGQTKAVTLHLSGAARSLLAKLHVLAAKATIVARNKAGVSATTTLTLTLKPAKKHH